MQKLVFAAALALATPALAGSIRITPISTMGAPVEYRQGRAGSLSSLARTDVALMIERAVIDERDFPTVRLGVKNNGPVAVNMVPEAVQVTTNQGVYLPILTHDELAAAVEADARKRESRARFAAKLDAVGAAMRDRPTRPNPSVQAGVREAQEETAAVLDAIADRGFLAQTVRSGEEHMTDLGLGPLPKGVTSLTIKVTLGEETHTFLLNVAR